MDFFTTYSLLVLSAARKDSQEYVHQDETSMPDAAAPGKYVNNNPGSPTSCDSDFGDNRWLRLPSELFDWPVRYLDIYLFCIYCSLSPLELDPQTAS